MWCGSIILHPLTRPHGALQADVQLCRLVRVEAASKQTWCGCSFRRLRTGATTDLISVGREDSTKQRTSTLIVPPRRGSNARTMCAGRVCRRRSTLPAVRGKMRPVRSARGCHLTSFTRHAVCSKGLGNPQWAGPSTLSIEATNDDIFRCLNSIKCRPTQIVGKCPTTSATDRHSKR